MGVSAGLALLLVFGLLDQTSASAVPAYARNAAHHFSDRAFVARIENTVPKGAMVYQLPYVSFPESAPVAETGGYDQVRGYLYSKHLRWTFGGMRGRDHAWQDALMGQPLDLFLDRLAATGFAGLWIDRHGYTDGARSLESALQTELGSQPLVSDDGRLSFFSLADFAASLRASHPAAALDALAAQTLSPIEIRPGEGAERHREDGATTWLDGAASTTLYALNPDRATRAVVFDARIEAAGPGTLTVMWPDGSAEPIPLTAGETPLHRSITVAPGMRPIGFATDTPAFPARMSEGDVHFRLLQPAIYDAPPPGL